MNKTAPAGKGGERVEGKNTTMEAAAEQPAVNDQDAALKKRHKRRMRALRSFLLR